MRRLSKGGLEAIRLFFVLTVITTFLLILLPSGEEDNYVLVASLCCNAALAINGRIKEIEKEEEGGVAGAVNQET